MNVLFNQIKDHIAFYHNQSLISNNTKYFLEFKTELKGHRRQYAVGMNISDTRAAIEIKEDGGTRTVFNGFVYTIEQFLTIDACAR